MDGLITYPNVNAPERSFVRTAVIPVPATPTGFDVDIEKAKELQQEPWKVDAAGRVHSYRVTFTAKDSTASAVSIQPKSGSVSTTPFVPHSSVIELFASASSVRVSLHGIRNELISGDLLTSHRKLCSGPVEMSSLFHGPLRVEGEHGIPSGEQRGGFFAVVSMYRDLPFVVVDLAIHNADWTQQVKGDLWHQGCSFTLPEGFTSRAVGYNSLEFDGGSHDAHILPMQGVRVATFVIWKSADPEPMDSEIPSMNTASVDPFGDARDGLSFANPLLQSYLPQGLPVEASIDLATARAAHIRGAIENGTAVDWMSEGRAGTKGVAFHAEGSPYGGAGSSYGVERFCEIGLGLHGFAEELKAWQSLTLNRQPEFLINQDANGIDTNAYAPGPKPWKLFLSPSPRGVIESRSGGTPLWAPGRDPYGFRDALQADETYASEHNYRCPYFSHVFGYGTYDRQHYRRALRATLPLAYLCGDRMSAELLRLQAINARVEFWDGESPALVDSPHENRVRWLADIASEEHGFPGGREDAWAIDTVLAATQLASTPSFLLPMRDWLNVYAKALVAGQMPNGLLQSVQSGKELEEWQYRFSINQGYQESMLAWAALGIARTFGFDQSATTARQALGSIELHGRTPAYKIAIEDMDHGMIVRDSQHQAAYPFPKTDATQNNFVPSFACAALQISWANAEERTLLLDWLLAFTGSASVEELTSWTPLSHDLEREAACLAPSVRWLVKNGLTLEE